jgi:dTDP-4-amino-4,6-dideoxygalactose transaminase
MIQVTKTYLPEQEKYFDYLKEIWKTGWLTNNGPMVLKLEERLKQYLNIKNFNYCNNGTVALQIALKALDISKEVITTPFSYVATTNVILWENCKPVFVDINTTDFNIDTKQIESKITEKTEAILATHVFGNPCNIYEIETIAKKYNLKVIYDAAHAFGVNYNDESLLSYGDISTCSFHATKIFHTGEGGAIICNDNETQKKVYLMRQFGHIWDEYFSIGINGKASELHAAMGLCVLDDFEHILKRRKWVTMYYNERLNFSKLQVPSPLPGTKYNYAYYPIVFSDEKTLLRVCDALLKENIFPRRYFYPSLNNLRYLAEHCACPVSESISSRILCLPLYTYLVGEELNKIISLTNNNL